MKPIVILGVAQLYPGYGCEQVTIVASRIPDTIVAFGQTRHNTFVHQAVFRSVMKKLLNFQDYTIQDRCKILMTICH
jgi:hypothetical protein